MPETIPLICVPCQPRDIADRLAESLRKQDLAEFQAAASHLGELTAEARSCPEVVTCLCNACRDPAAGAYVRALLDAGVEPNTPDKTKSKAPTPLQVAAEGNNLDVIKILLAYPMVDVAVRDRFGDNVFHWIVKNKGSSELQAKCIAELLQHKQTFSIINHENKRYESAVLIAAGRCSLEVVTALLSCPGIDLDTATAVGTNLSARSLIEQRFPSLGDRLPPPLDVAFTDNDLMRLMDDVGDAERIGTFCDKIRRGECQNLNYNDDDHTFLQRACKKGLIDIVNVLLESEADPVAVCPQNKQPPPVIASNYGFPDIVESFLKKSDVSRKVFKMKHDNGDTSLIQLLRAWDDDKSDAYFACLELLLDLDVELNATNETGNSALHYAALTGERRVMLAVLKKGAYIGGLNKLGRPPIVNISYDILEAHFNECIESYNQPFSDNYKIEFDYSCLVPPVKQKLEKPKGSKSDDPEIGNHFLEAKDEDEETAFYLETHPLVYMSRHPELRPLLKHPVLTSFLELKWNRLSAIYHFNTLFYFLFVVAISVHILSGNGRVRPGESQKENTNESMTTFQAPAGLYCEKWVHRNSTSDEKNNSSTNDPDDSEYKTVFNILQCVVIALWGVLVLREVIQFAISPKRYFSPSNKENYVELLLIISCFLFGIVQFLDYYDYARFFAAITILFTYGEFVLLVGRYPKLSTYIEMLRRVSWNFSKFILWYSILILAFALSFYTLFRDSNAESNFFKLIGMSLFKTVVMMTGEFEVGDIPFVELPILSHVVFVLFVFLIAIVLFNLLNGLAVSDTQAIKNDAELVGYVSRVHLIAYIEKIILGDATQNSCNTWTPFLRIGWLMRSVQLFPDTKHYIGRVVPNDSSYLYLTLRENYHEKISFVPRQCVGKFLGWCNLDCCCLPEPANCDLARDIVKGAEEVVAMKSRPSDLEVIKMALAATEEKLEAMENRWKETERMLRDIWNAVGEGQRK